LQPRLFLEGDLDHPADYESVACLDEPEFGRLLESHPAEKDLLEESATRRQGRVFIGYRKLPAPQALVDALAHYEIYELPAAEYCQVAAQRWQEFAREAIAGPFIYIFECCFLQNPLTTLLAKHNWSGQAAGEHVLNLAETIRPLAPRLVYLNPPSIRDTLAAAARTRPVEWLEYVTGYITGQAWGVARGESGFDGMARFYAERCTLERALLAHLGLPFLWIDSAGQNWPAAYAQIESFLLPL
jgi:hypothetical protein